MKLSIFSRLFLGYITIILILGAISAYTVLRLRQVNAEVGIIFNVDQRAVDLKQKLVDSLLSHVGSEKKYVITGDPIFLTQMTSGQKAFEGYLSGISEIAGASSNRDILARVRSEYGRYLSLVNEEVEMSKTGLPYSRSDYGQRKEEAVGQVLEALKTLETSYLKDIQERMNRIQETAGSAERLSILMFAGAVLIVILGSLVSTRSITKPLKVLMAKTREVSRGVFEGNLDIGSPREVAELAGAVNLMCEKLKKVDTMKSGFFATMSHELRTPLASIKQGISLLRDGAGGPIPDKQKRLFAILSEETNRLIDLVNSLLELSKMEAGMMPFTFGKENIQSLINRVVMEMTPLVEAKKIHIEVDTGDEGDIPPLKLDRERILQALRNLLGNAVKFTPENGSITIEAGRRDRTVQFSIRDTGPGIPKENLETIFEKFHQSPGQAPGSMKGTGLGLAFVKHIITAHGGKVWAQSEPGEGTVFLFVLPL
ncbi:MAG: HAMP domain-containing protein [Syntrophorhabdus sp.]|nr:HAMP domain-containing protein [Syntrophorhabdus sp.]